MPAIIEREPEKQRGSISELREESSLRPHAFDLAMLEDLREAEDDRDAQVSQIEANVYERIEPVFPVLLRKQAQHQMKATDLYNELDMILSMADIADPHANVFVYSLQVIEPQNLGNRLRKMVLDLVPPSLMPEVVNGYFRHELLYGLRESERSIILVNTIQSAAKIEVSLKPPWSPYRASVLVTLD